MRFIFIHMTMRAKSLLFLLFTFALVLDARAVTFTYKGVPHFITTGKHIILKWPPEIKEIKDEGENLLQNVQ